MDPTTSLLVGAALGAVLGLAVNELHRVGLEAVRRSDSFYDELELLKSTIKTVTPTIREIDQSTNRDSYPREVVEEIVMSKKLLMRANDLVMTCSYMRRRDVVKKYRYTKKIKELNDSLRAHFNLNMSVRDHGYQVEEEY